MNETIDFKDYIFEGETWLNVRGLNGIVPEMDIKITRYLKNKFIIFLTFYTDYSHIRISNMQSNTVGLVLYYISHRNLLRSLSIAACPLCHPLL